MNYSNFSLADVILVISALFFGFFCFLGFNFLSMGDTIDSITKASLITLGLFSFAYGMKLLKQTRKNFKVTMMMEGVLLFLFIGLAYFSFFSFSHYFTVLKRQDAIYTKLAKSIEEAKKMFDIYENEYVERRLSIYKDAMESCARNKYSNLSDCRRLGLNIDVPIEVLIDENYNILKGQIQPGDFKKVKDGSVEWLNSQKNILENKWSFSFGIINLVNEFQPKFDEWAGKLNHWSQYRAKGEDSNDFDYKTEVSIHEVKVMISEAQSSSKFLALVVSSILNLLMLFSYFVTYRDSRYPGWQILFRSNINAANENEI